MYTPGDKNVLNVSFYILQSTVVQWVSGDFTPGVKWPGWRWPLTSI